MLRRKICWPWSKFETSILAGLTIFAATYLQVCGVDHQTDIADFAPTLNGDGLLARGGAALPDLLSQTEPVGRRLVCILSGVIWSLCWCITPAFACSGFFGDLPSVVDHVTTANITRSVRNSRRVGHGQLGAWASFQQPFSDTRRYSQSRQCGWPSGPVTARFR